MQLCGTAIPGMDALAAQITQIFQKYFGRVPLAAGLQFWQNSVANGSVDDANLPMAIVQAAAPADKLYFQQNFTQLAEQVYGPQTPAPGPTPLTAPVVTSTAPVSATGASANMAPVATGSDIPLPLIAGGALLLYMFLGKK